MPINKQYLKEILSKMDVEEEQNDNHQSLSIDSIDYAQSNEDHCFAIL